MDKVSVIICNYNQKAYLEQSVRSVLEQSYENIELIVIDNGSTDGSVDLLKSYSKHANVKLLLHEQNRKVTTRLNEAVRFATGEFVSFLYADDFYLPEFIETQIREFAKLSSEYGVVYSPGIRLNEVSGQSWQSASLQDSGWIFNAILKNYYRIGYINPISPLSRRKCLLEFPFRENVFQEAEIIYLRIASKYKFQFVAEPLVVMREHENNLGKAIRRNSECFFTNMRSLESDGIPRGSEKLFRRFKAESWLNHGWQAIRMGENPQWSRDCFISAINCCPFYLVKPKIICGLLLSYLPTLLRMKINQIGYLVSRPKEIIKVRQSYA